MCQSYTQMHIRKKYTPTHSRKHTEKLTLCISVCVTCVFLDTWGNTCVPISVLPFIAPFVLSLSCICNPPNHFYVPLCVAGAKTE